MRNYCKTIPVKISKEFYNIGVVDDDRLINDDLIFKARMTMPQTSCDYYIKRIPRHHFGVSGMFASLTENPKKHLLEKEFLFSCGGFVVDFMYIEEGKQVKSGDILMDVSYGVFTALSVGNQSEKEIAREHIKKMYGSLNEQDILLLDRGNLLKMALFQEVLGYDDVKAIWLTLCTKVVKIDL